jgi:hypothetical protein
MNQQEQREWFDDELESLHRFEAGEEPKDDFIPDSALRLLPPDRITNLLFHTFNSYFERAEAWSIKCMEDGTTERAIAFMNAHRKIMDDFDFTPHHYYNDMARTIGHHAKCRKDEQFLESLPAKVVQARRSVSTPLSGPPTPCTVLSWINNVESGSPSPMPNLSPEIVEHISTGSPIPQSCYPRRVRPTDVEHLPMKIQKKARTTKGTGKRKKIFTTPRKPRTPLLKDESKGPRSTKRKTSDDDDDAVDIGSHVKNSRKRRHRAGRAIKGK